eukprot:6180874-Prymnesium_polylepis.1
MQKPHRLGRSDSPLRNRHARVGAVARARSELLRARGDAAAAGAQLDAQDLLAGRLCLPSRRRWAAR